MFIIIALYPTSSCSHLLLRLVFDSLVKIPKYCDGQTVYGGENTGECRWCKAVSLPHPNTHQIPIGMWFAHLILAQNCKQLIFLLQMLHKNQVCIVECLIHRLSRKWRNMNKNLLSPLQRIFPGWFTVGGSLAPVNGFLHPGYCCLNPPSGQKGTSVQKCFDTSLANI